MKKCQKEIFFIVLILLIALVSNLKLKKTQSKKGFSIKLKKLNNNARSSSFISKNQEEIFPHSYGKLFL